MATTSQLGISPYDTTTALAVRVRAAAVDKPTLEPNCQARLNDGPLQCMRTDPHTRGHIYRSSHGSEVDDRHRDGGHG